MKRNFSLRFEQALFNAACRFQTSAQPVFWGYFTSMVLVLGYAATRLFSIEISLLWLILPLTLNLVWNFVYSFLAHVDYSPIMITFMIGGNLNEKSVGITSMQNGIFFCLYIFFYVEFVLKYFHSLSPKIVALGLVATFLGYLLVTAFMVNLGRNRGGQFSFSREFIQEETDTEEGEYAQTV